MGQAFTPLEQNLSGNSGATLRSPASSVLTLSPIVSGHRADPEELDVATLRGTLAYEGWEVAPLLSPRRTVLR